LGKGGAFNVSTCSCVGGFGADDQHESQIAMNAPNRFTGDDE